MEGLFRLTPHVKPQDPQSAPMMPVVHPICDLLSKQLWPHLTLYALSVWINLGKHSFFLWLFVSSVKAGVVQVAQ